MTELYRFLDSVERNFLGYDRTFRQLEDAYSTFPRTRSEGGYPPYNIFKEGDNLRIELAIAGFGEKDVDIFYENGELTITGDKERDDTQISQEVLHQGIAYRKFTRRFNLASTIRVEGATFNDGILTIHLKNVLPEHLQAKKIQIQRGTLDRGQQELLNG